MAQSDINVGNQTAPAFRSDLNSALEALATNSSGSTAPSALFGYMFWYDTANDLLKINLSGTWATIGKLDTVSNTFDPYINGKQVADFLDEDTMSSNSATAVASQQSIKAYVDTQVSSLGTPTTAGDVGTYVFAYSTSGDTSFGSTRAGSSLRPTSAARSGIDGGSGIVGPFSFNTGTALSGTWRCMGQFDQRDPATGSGAEGATLWVRIS